MADIGPIKLTIRVDTYANLASNNPTLGTSLGGKDYRGFVIATGSDHGTILVHGKEQTFNAAYSAGQYFNIDTTTLTASTGSIDTDDTILIFEDGIQKSISIANLFGNIPGPVVIAGQLTVSSGGADIAGPLTISGDIYSNGAAYYGDSKEIIRFSDVWLRLNAEGDFSSGIYCGSSLFRTDGQLQVGEDGLDFLSVPGSSGYTRLGRPLDLPEISTPSNPSSGFNRLYFKSDDKLYQLSSSGSESVISYYDTLTNSGSNYIITSKAPRVFLTFTRDATARTITLSTVTGQSQKIKVVGAGAGNVTLQGPSSQNIQLTDGTTVTSLTWDGQGIIEVMYNGSTYDIVSTGAWDSKVSGNTSWEKYTSGIGFYAERTIDFSTTTSASDFFGSTSGTSYYDDVTVSFDFDLNQILCSNLTSVSASTSIAYSVTAISTTSYTLRAWRKGSGDPTTLDLEVKFKWA